MGWPSRSRAYRVRLLFRTESQCGGTAVSSGCQAYPALYWVQLMPAELMMLRLEAVRLRNPAFRQRLERFFSSHNASASR